jgi:HEAT repeat protein
MIRRVLAGLIVFAAIAAAARLQAGSSRPVFRQAAASAVSAADVAAAIDKLGSFDLPVRTAASRTIRRATAAIAVPPLTAAARQHRDGYTRYRALVLLSGFDDPSAPVLMRQLITDRNDRVRMVVYAWYERHADPAVIPALVEALGQEQSEFVRPALLRALVAHGSDARARNAVLPFIMRGQDDFRGAVIEALGEYRATYAIAPISEVARLDGPLQDDAVTALGRIGDVSTHDLLAELQRAAPRQVQPSIAAALSLLGSNVAANESYLKQTLQFAASVAGNQPLLRGAAHALAVLAGKNNPDALTTLFDYGVPAKDQVRAPLALAVGMAALRAPDVLFRALEPRKDRAAALELLQEAFDMLSSEDFELERFYMEVRHIYWSEPPNSTRRQLAESIIAALEF